MAESSTDLFTTEWPPTELSSDDGSSDEAYERFLDIFGKTYYPIVIVSGLIGNAINLLILSRPSLAKHSSNVYLFGLAVADILVLTFQGNFKYTVFKAYHVTGPPAFFEFLCTWNNLILIGAVRTSMWITVAVSIDRYVAVVHPIAGRTWSTPRRAKMTIPFIFLCGFVYGIHAFFLREVKDGQCVFSTAGERWREFFSKLNASAFMVTYILLVLFNGMIVLNVWIRSLARKKKVKPREIQVAPVPVPGEKVAAKGPTDAQTERRLAAQYRLTLTLVMVSVIFMICWSPYLTKYMMAQLPTNVGGLPGRDYLSLFAEFMAVLNSALNFYLYSVTNKSFRAQCVRIFCRRRPVRAERSVTTASSVVANGTQAETHR